MKYNIQEFIEQLKKQYNVEYIKEKFKNVYFIIGTAYAGKSTMVKMLSEHNNGIMCGENYALDALKNYDINPKEHPNLCFTQTMKDWDEFINRTPKEYVMWLRGSEIEITPIEINELLKLTKNSDKRIFVDTNIPLEILKLISDYDHIAVMLAEQSMSVNKFFDRNDFEKNLILSKIKESKNPNAMENYKKILREMNSMERYNYFLNSGLYIFKRDDSLTLEETMYTLEKHFKLTEVIH